MKVHVRQGAMLGNVKAYGDRRRVSILQVEVNVAHATVKGEFTRIDYGRARGRAAVCEGNHVASGSLLKARRIPAQNESRAMFPIAHQSDPLPDVNRLAQPVVSIWNKNHSLARRLLYPIDGLL